MARQESIANVYDGLPLVLTAADFEAPDAAGGTYLFERLLGWGAAMRVRLRAKRVPLEISAPPASDGERRLFFSRSLARSKGSERVEDRADAAAKAPIRRTRPNGACLSFALTEDAVEVALELPAKAKSERGALMDLLGDRVTRTALIATIRALPHPFVIGRSLEPARERLAVQEISADVLLSILTESSRGSDGLWIGWHVPRSLALAHAATFGGETEGAMLALGEFFRQIAWSPSAPAPRAKRVSRGRGRSHGRESDDAAVTGSEGEANENAADVSSERARDGATRGSVSPKDEAPTSNRGRALLRSASSSRSVSARGQMRLHSAVGRRLGVTSRPSKSKVAAHAHAHAKTDSDAFERGTEVHVLAGPFEGRIGVVQELDGKGHARVLLGLLATRIPLVDLERGKGPSSERPALASSHRKART